MSWDLKTSGPLTLHGPMTKITQGQMMGDMEVTGAI